MQCMKIIMKLYEKIIEIEYDEKRKIVKLFNKSSLDLFSNKRPMYK